MDSQAWDLQSLTPSRICQGFFVIGGLSIVSLTFLPDAMYKSTFYYGARRLGQDGQTRSLGAALVHRVLSFAQVPHGWFIHYYMASVAWSVFWAFQYLNEGSVMRSLAERQQVTVGGAVDLGRVSVVWALMAVQGSRRLYECVFVTKSGTTPMTLAHWLLGLSYYTFAGITVWIEGSDAILRSWDSKQEISTSMLTPRTLFGVAVFLYASFKQNRCHAHLASLKKYTLPSEGWFGSIVSPHYTAECLLYLAIAFVAAPPDRWFSTTWLCLLVFVGGNLGMTARNTRRWYAEKFGADKVKGRWCMIPFVF